MTEVTSVQPWGYAPTPVIPKVLLDDLGHLTIPQHLRKALNGCSTIQELHSDVWNRGNSLDPDLLNALVRKIGTKLRSVGKIDIRLGAPLSIELEDLPFSTRTRNAIVKNKALFLSEKLTIAEVLRVPNLGVKSVLEFACVIEAATSIANLSGNHVSSEECSPISRARNTPSELKSFFQLLAAYAAGEKGVKTIGDVLPFAKEGWPTEIKYLWKSVGALEAEGLAGELVQRYSMTTLLEQWIGPIDERLRKILVRRTFELDRRETLEQLGSSLDVTRERVRQLEKKAKQHLARLEHAEYGPILRAANQLRHILGKAVPQDDWSARRSVLKAVPALGDLGDEMPAFTVGLLVYLAGPFNTAKGWILTDNKLTASTRDDLLSCADDRGLITDANVSEYLSTIPIREKYRTQWIDHLQGFKRVDDGYIYLIGNILDKAKVLLKYYGRPLTVDEMIPDLGSDSVRSVRQRLIDDPGFWRINKQSEFVIAGAIGYDEYTGISDEIIQELEACGGKASVNYLVSKLATVYGVAESSVHAYLGAPIFSRDSYGIVRLRRDDEPIELNLDIGKALGCYVNEVGNWCWRVDVDSLLMRGSGRMSPNAFVGLVGCGVGEKIEIDSNHGPITFSWPATSAAGASIGSLRQAVEDLKADIGDYLFVAKERQRILITRLSTAELESTRSKLGRLLKLVGREEAEDRTAMIGALSDALQVSGATVDSKANACRLKLESRGEGELAALIDETTQSIEDYLLGMEQLFKG